MTYWLWARKDTISPLTLHIYEMLKDQFEQREAEPP
jgi:hypothetical protein